MKTIMSPLRSQPGVQSFQPPIWTSNQKPQQTSNRSRPRPTVAVFVRQSSSHSVHPEMNQNEPIRIDHHHHLHVRLLDGVVDDRRRNDHKICSLSLSFSLYSVWTPVTKQWLELWPKGKVWLFDLGQVKNLCGWIEREWMWYLKRWDEMEKEKYNECTYRVHSWWDRGNLSDLGLECDGCGIWMGWWEPRYLGVFRPFLVEKRAGVGKVLRVRAPTGLL